MSTEEKRHSPSSSSSAIEKERTSASEGEIKELPIVTGAIGDAATTTTVEIDEKKLLRKIDFALVPWLSVLYLVGEALIFIFEIRSLILIPFQPFWIAQVLGMQRSFRNYLYSLGFLIPHCSYTT